MTDIFEGSIIRVARRLDELMQQLARAAQVSCGLFDLTSLMMITMMSSAADDDDELMQQLARAAQLSER